MAKSRFQTTSMSALEDDFTYVLRKALAGHGLAPATAASRAGLPERDVLELLRGTFSPASARRIAAVLDLNPDAYAKHSDYLPEPVVLSGLERIDLVFRNERVNAWLVNHENASVLFDAGYEAQDLLQAIHSVQGRLPDRVFITHSHIDHVGAIGDFLAAGIPVNAAGIPGTIPTQAGEIIDCGAFVVRASDLSGHAMPALGFHVDGLETPVLVTGDALFAGSIGGCPSPKIYQLALGSLRAVLDSVDDSTILLPGHGPGSTLREERLGNPFL